MSNSKHTPGEKRHFTDDAIHLMSMLPPGMTDEWIKKMYVVFGRTRTETAAPRSSGRAGKTL